MTIREELATVLTKRGQKIKQLELHADLINKTVEQFRKIPESKTKITIGLLIQMKKDARALERDIRKLNRTANKLQRKIDNGQT